jgi:hypothetical protein
MIAGSQTQLWTFLGMCTWGRPGQQEGGEAEITREEANRSNTSDHRQYLVVACDSRPFAGPHCIQQYNTILSRVSQLRP